MEGLERDHGVKEYMIIGVIGGVGAGKSTVLEILEQSYSCRIYRTDDIAKSFYQAGNPVFTSLRELLGDDMIRDDHIDIPKLGQKLYQAGNAGLRERIERIVHPAVWKNVDARIRDAKKEGRNIVVETALPTGHFTEKCDEVWFVHCEPEIRIKRLMESRGYSREKAFGIIRSQMEDEEYFSLADWVIENSGTEEETRNEIYEHCKRLEW